MGATEFCLYGHSQVSCPLWIVHEDDAITTVIDGIALMLVMRLPWRKHIAAGLTRADGHLES